MEVELIGRGGLVRAVVDLDPVLAGLLAFVGQGDACGAGKRHGDVAVPRRPGGGRIGQVARPLVDAHHRRVEPLAEAEAFGEEIADRRLDARLLLPVPINPQNVELQVVRLVTGDVVAEVDDAARPLDIGQDARLAWGDGPVVIVAAGWVG
jgi:hypothetical protein